jgi:hypothetical protein
MQQTAKTFIQFMLFILLFTDCKKAVETDPPVSLLSGKKVFANDTSAIALVSGIYSFMTTSHSFAQGNSSIGLLTGLASDELQGIHVDPYQLFYKNALTPAAFSSKYFWEPIYSQIYTCNVALEGIISSDGMSESVKKQLAGEVKFMRAFLYFQLVNLFGDIPLALSSDYRINNKLFRTTASEVYRQIIRDLKDAEAGLGEIYVDGFARTITERVRPNKWAAASLLARVYLYSKDWANAEMEGGRVISNSEFVLEPDLNKVFLSTSKEAIFQLQSRQSTFDWRVYGVLNGQQLDQIHPVALSSDIINAFEANDVRFIKWISKNTVVNNTIPATTYYHPHKYKLLLTGIFDHLMVLRLAEQYLIRAEARVAMNNLTGAKADLDVIRVRAGLPRTTANTKEAILNAIAHERRIELFTEWGHRWFDLKRTGAIDSVMKNIAIEKASIWNTNFKLFPIPQTEILLNSRLIQNNGY